MTAASRQVWNWRENTSSRRREDLAARLRRHGLVGGLVAISVGTALNLVLGHALLGRVIVVLGALQAMAALWRPLALEAPTRWLRRFGLAVGTGLAWLLLTPLWLLVFVPAGLWLRLRGRDPLHRERLESGLTAWIPRRHVSDADSAARQFLVEDREARSLRRPEGALPATEQVAAADRAGGPPA